MYQDLRICLHQLFDLPYNKKKINQCIFYFSLIELWQIPIVYSEFYSLLITTGLMDPLIENYIKIGGNNYLVNMQDEVNIWLNKRINIHLDNI